jgi:GT2 family glycosyltransferase
MALPLIDIGIPVFQRADYVAEAIESVLAQSYQHWRLTVSEDGPQTDPVRLAVEPYLGDERVRYVSTGKWLGLARNKSSLAATGEGKYLALLDDDDIWLADWLARRIEFLETSGDCVLVWGGHFDIDSGGTRLARSPFPLPGGVHEPREFVRMMMRRNAIATSSVLLRRSAYRRAGNSFDPRFLVINDYELWLRLGMVGRVGFLPIHDSARRVHPGQMTVRPNQALDHLLLIDHLDGLLERADLGLRLSPTARRRLKADRSLSVALDSAEQGNSRSAARRISEAIGLDPRALATPRGLGAIVATLGGRRVGSRIGALRRR